MTDDQDPPRRLESREKGLLVGAGVAAGLVVVPYFRPLLLGMLAGGPLFANSGNFVESGLAVGVVLAIPGGIAGALGAAVAKSLPAVALGAIVFALPAGILLAFAEGLRMEILLGLCAVSAMGGLAGLAGAISGRTVGQPGEPSRPLQVSLLELFIITSLLAVIFSFVFYR